MLDFMESHKVIVKRYSATLGEYNRPKKELNTVGTYMCHVAQNSSNTAQKQPQKEATTELTLYTEPEADIKCGDVLYTYAVDEYGEAIQSTEVKSLADKPYIKRTFMSVSLLSAEEI